MTTTPGRPFHCPVPGPAREPRLSLDGDVDPSAHTSQQIEKQPPVETSYVVPDTRVKSLLNSYSHSTELATAAQRNQSPGLRLTVEKACCRNGM